MPSSSVAVAREADLLVRPVYFGLASRFEASCCFEASCYFGVMRQKARGPRPRTNPIAADRLRAAGLVVFFVAPVS